MKITKSTTLARGEIVDCWLYRDSIIIESTRTKGYEVRILNFTTGQELADDWLPTIEACTAWVDDEMACNEAMEELL